jgi:hypothetical protein
MRGIARYGALGVLTEDRASLKDFIYVGVPGDTAREIGHLPEGKGLLGAVIQEAGRSESRRSRRTHAQPGFLRRTRR